MKYEIRTERINAPNHPSDQGIKATLTASNNDGGIVEVVEREDWVAPSHEYAASELMITYAST